MMTAEFMLSKRQVLKFTAALFFLLKDVIKSITLEREVGSHYVRQFAIHFFTKRFTAKFSFIVIKKGTDIHFPTE